MIKRSRQALVNYLYSSDELRKLMCNDIYQELLEFIPIDMCISDENCNPVVRVNNFNFVKGAIKGFIVGNKTYQNVLFNLYKHNRIDAIVYDILIGFVLYISCTIKEFELVDILDDSRSICFDDTFIEDLIS